MTKVKSGLGRGLGALIPTFTPGVEAVDVDLIVSNPHQPRAHFDPESLSELAQSIGEHGVIQPLLVTRVQPEGDGPAVYQLIAGERRLQAARLAGLTRVPVVVKEASSSELLELALVENLQRADLNALEEAQAFRRLLDEFGLTQEGVAARIGRSRTAVANTLRLLTLSEELKASLARGEISEGHARALLGLADEAQRRQAWRKVVERGLSVRETEALVRRWPAASRTRTARQRPDPDVSDLEQRLRAALGTRVSLRRGRRGGRLTIHFYSDEEFQALLDRLLGS
jgi:ParB family transcriptional regulator, chromosome partitioning protein